MTTDTVGGVWTYALELTDALAPYGVSVTLATMGPPMSVDQRRAAVAAGVEDVHESTYPLEWMGAPWPDVDAAGEWLLDLERRVRPDLVHLNGYVHAALPWRAPSLVVGHSCVTSWWRAVHGEEPPAEWAEYRQRVAAGLTAAGTVVAPTAAMLAELTAAYGVGEGVVIPNCRCAGWVRPVDKEPLVLAAGRVWDDAKNAAAVARAAPSLGWPVAIAGDDRGTEHEHAADARWLGRLPFDELAGWLARASIFALPARYEPFGLGPLEAALAGCALVLGDIPSLREVWGSAATYVGPDDDAALVDACRALIASPARLAERADAARRRAQVFTPERTAAAYHHAYVGALAPALVGAAR